MSIENMLIQVLDRVQDKYSMTFAFGAGLYYVGSWIRFYHRLYNHGRDGESVCLF